MVHTHETTPRRHDRLALVFIVELALAVLASVVIVAAGARPAGFLPHEGAAGSWCTAVLQGFGPAT